MKKQKTILFFLNCNKSDYDVKITKKKTSNFYELNNQAIHFMKTKIYFGTILFIIKKGLYYC
jgi:hypothetical protein